MRQILIAFLILIWTSAGYSEKHIQKNNALVPGFYQFKTGQKLKGYGLVVLQAGTLAGGIYYRMNSDGDVWMEKFKRATDARLIDRYARKYQDAQDNKKWSRHLFWAAGGVYTINLLDALLYRQEKVSVSVMPSGMVRVAYRF
jgi:hypothetical protein